MKNNLIIPIEIFCTKGFQAVKRGESKSKQKIKIMLFLFQKLYEKKFPICLNIKAFDSLGDIIFDEFESFKSLNNSLIYQFIYKFLRDFVEDNEINIFKFDGKPKNKQQLLFELRIWKNLINEREEYGNKKNKF